MPNAIASFFKRRDELSSTVNLNYKGQMKHGTVLGGCVSCLTNTFFTIFISMQIYGWVFQPAYDQNLG